MIRRWTLWETDEGSELQLSLCLLDDNWEPLWEATKQCGPFHDVEEQRLALNDDLRRWYRHTGHQLSLL